MVRKVMRFYGQEGYEVLFRGFVVRKVMRLCGVL